MSDSLFDFDDVTMDVVPGVAVATPPPRRSASVDQPLGTLFEGSPAFVASEVTGGGRGNERVCLLLVRHVEDVCGGEIKGDGSVVRFCSKPPDLCTIASHAKSKAALRPGCLYPFVPRKGENQVRLEPSLPLSLVPSDVPLDMLILEEKSISLWQTFMDACRASEAKTGRHELALPSPREDMPPWEEDFEAPSLQELDDADDFRTPKKVRLISGLKKQVAEEYSHLPEIGSVPLLLLDLSAVTPHLQAQLWGSQMVMSFLSLTMAFFIIILRYFHLIMYHFTCLCHFRHSDAHSYVMLCNLHFIKLQNQGIFKGHFKCDMIIFEFERTLFHNT